MHVILDGTISIESVEIVVFVAMVRTDVQLFTTTNELSHDVDHLS